MTEGSNRPIIIKRKKVIAGGGHHGGAWKVAYADFVTAMMAFFMLMWLLNATTEQQRAGIADYFSPTIPFSQLSGGGEGTLSGDSLQTLDTLLAMGTGGIAELEAGQAAGIAAAADMQALRDLESALLGLGGESMELENAMRQLVTRMTDEGLVIELFDLPDAPLFVDLTARPQPVTVELITLISRVIRLVSNDIAVVGHVAAEQGQSPWDLSMDRAGQTRAMLQVTGTTPERIVRTTGTADRKPIVSPDDAIRNNRVQIILLRSGL
ncbi:flagellar motor protein MotB [Loktanella sp. SALINAS62]|uniref:flagellar motor protein MotB n=1 Tax=Loktanella sp. SALINAS62 TaxID=2706124 RepID=UPI001B8C746C|nr:flagellar motor protein MotB [Loktanella sp. SALINAS62]MBS1301868.1 chemotaxis protein MotB [Loktanella sp. SALINAS62]